MDSSMSNAKHAINLVNFSISRHFVQQKSAYLPFYINNIFLSQKDMPHKKKKT